MRISDNDRLLYENELHWDAVQLNDYVRSKIAAIKKIIPDEVMTIIDVGCGNGMISNELRQQWDIIGIDRSITALRHVLSPRVSADIQALPFADESFDLVLCSEVLEHLPGSLLYHAVSEMMRISRKYLLITVPYREYLPKNHIKCPFCAHIFNASYHYNSFDSDKLTSLFSNAKVLSKFYRGKQVRQYNPVLLKIKQNVGHSYARFSTDRYFICSNCQQHFRYVRKVNVISLLCDGLNRLLSRKRPYWLGMLFIKESR